MSIKLFYEEVYGYASIPSTKRNLILSRTDWRALASSRLAFSLFFVYKLALSLILLAAIIFISNIWFTLLLALVSLIFVVLIDKEIVNYALKLKLYKSNDHRVSKLISDETNGWYDDPFAYGKVGHERYWENGVWTNKTRVDFKS